MIQKFAQSEIRMQLRVSDIRDFGVSLFCSRRGNFQRADANTYLLQLVSEIQMLEISDNWNATSFLV